MRIDYVQQHAGNAAVYIRKRQRPYAHQCLEKFNIFTSESTKKQEKRGKEVAGWRFLQKIPSFTKNMQKLPSFTKFMQKLPSFTKKSKKIQKNFPLLQKNFPLLQKKLPSFTKNQKKQNFPLLQKTKKTKKPKCFGGFKSAIRSGI
jgi:hypothetical protein